MAAVSTVQLEACLSGKGRSLQKVSHLPPYQAVVTSQCIDGMVQYKTRSPVMVLAGTYPRLQYSVRPHNILLWPNISRDMPSDGHARSHGYNFQMRPRGFLATNPLLQPSSCFS